MCMRDTIQDALDDIGSPSASPHRRSRALAVLEQQLALACAPDVDDDTMHHFLELQDTFECNVPSRSFSWVQMAASRVEALVGKTSGHGDRETELNAICSQLYQLLSVIQGIALHHAASKVYLGRRYPLEILVALLTTSRHTSTITPSTVDSSTARMSPDKTWSISHLSSAVLDTLLCVLVDSSAALRTFEDVDGVQAVVKLLKRAGTPREVRMKCLEFLYFYLMDETTHDGSGGSAPSTPGTPVATHVLSFGSSSSSWSSSAFSAGTRSTQSSVRAPSPVKKSTSTPNVCTPPNSPPPGGRGTLAVLRRDVGYEPQSPTTAHGSCPTPRPGGEARTTEEKKAMLGTLLGNVDALVEGVRRAGIFGVTSSSEVRPACENAA